jgi:predicted GIY-YIG superfamily endonuclease
MIFLRELIDITIIKVQNLPRVINGNLVYKKRFYSKNKALSFEYKLKKDRNERLKLINDFKKNKKS